MNDVFSPLAIGPIRLRNRFIRSGANEMMTHGCVPTRSLLEFHRRLAAGGVGMTTLAYIAVSPDGRTFADQGVLTDASVPHYRAVTDAVHSGESTRWVSRLDSIPAASSGGEKIAALSA